MSKLYVGKIVGTHGIKGEVKISSDIEIKDKVFKENNILFIDDKEYKIKSVRFHKNNYLVLLNNFSNINEVLYLLKSKVYINREDILKDNEYVTEELLGFMVIDEKNNELGIIKDYEFNQSYATFLVEGKKNWYLPNVSNFVTNIDLENKKVYTKNVGELML